MSTRRCGVVVERQLRPLRVEQAKIRSQAAGTVERRLAHVVAEVGEPREDLGGPHGAQLLPAEPWATAVAPLDEVTGSVDS